MMSDSPNPVSAADGRRRNLLPEADRGVWLGLLVALAWSLVIGAVVVFAIFEESDKLREIARGEARGIFDLMVDTRSWVARHGKVYRLVTPDSPPNQYLKVPDRDLTTTGGLPLTMVNPSFATRQIGEIAGERGHAGIRIISSKPIRPGNAPLEWERPVLLALEKGQEEWSGFAALDGEKPVYRYMGPLRTDETCLECHAAQGYRVGDVRGALSIEIPVGRLLEARRAARRKLLPAALAVWLLGILLLAADIRNRRNRRQLTDRLAELSLTDELTGLSNRRGFMTLGEQHLRLADRLGQRFALLFIDLDGMKAVNDRHGHREGDRMLVLAAETLRRAFRSSDVIGRLGGDEFGVIALETAGEGPGGVVGRLADMVERVNAEDGGRPWKLSFSVGQAVRDPGRPETLDDLIRQADEAMYREKSAKKGQAGAGPLRRSP